MSSEAVVFQRTPFNYYGYELMNSTNGAWSLYGCEEDGWFSEKNDAHVFNINPNWDSSPYTMLQSLTGWDWSPEINCSGDQRFISCGGSEVSPVEAPEVRNGGKRKRRRIEKSEKKEKEEKENQRRTHIAVERNRRKQMNEYLSLLRSLLPPSYVQRGDQASIIGGTINFLKELEHLLQFLEAKQRFNQQNYSNLFSDFFTFPQYSMNSTTQYNDNTAIPNDMMVEKLSAIANVEVTKVESHANIKVLSKTSSKYLPKMVVGLHSLHLTILHLNVTTVDHMVLRCFSSQVEEDCELSSAKEIAAAVYELVVKIQDEDESSRSL